jgi:2-polyprenyl-3-methyl-5-hydroxy-6-metoxy-1,4-benzoquinol methylase
MIFTDVLQNITGVDFDEDSIAYANETFADENIKFIASDIFDLGKIGTFDAVVSMDVIEHIEKSMEDEFMEIICKNLETHGIVVIGTPNITAAQYQSKESEIGHINMYDHVRLYDLINKYFYNTFIFSANDETVHTGFYPMAHYFIAVGAGKRNG